MNLAFCESLSHRLRGGATYDGLANLAQSLRASIRRPGSLHVIGPRESEPWHLTAHLEMLARYRDVPELTPAPRHLEVTDACDGDVVLLVSEERATDSLLQQLGDARSRGSIILGLTAAADDRLGSVAAESLAVSLDDAHLGAPGIVLDFETTTHLLGVAAAASKRRRWWSR